MALAESEVVVGPAVDDVLKKWFGVVSSSPETSPVKLMA